MTEQRKQQMNRPTPRVMTIAPSRQRGRALAQALHRHGCQVIDCADTLQDMSRRIATARPDAILIDLPTADFAALAHLTARAGQHPRPMVLLTAGADPAFIRKAVEAGCGACVSYPLDDAPLRAAIETAIAHFQQYQWLHTELARARNALEERKLIERAKGLLMRRDKLDEHDAYATMRRMAMNRNRRLADTAREILNTAPTADAAHRPSPPGPDV